jgi:hypothetical protein
VSFKSTRGKKALFLCLQIPPAPTMHPFVVPSLTFNKLTGAVNRVTLFWGGGSRNWLPFGQALDEDQIGKGHDLGGHQ